MGIFVALNLVTINIWMVVITLFIILFSQPIIIFLLFDYIGEKIDETRRLTRFEEFCTYCEKGTETRCYVCGVPICLDHSFDEVIERDGHQGIIFRCKKCHKKYEREKKRG